MFAPWRSQNPARKTWISDYWKIIRWNPAGCCCDFISPWPFGAFMCKVVWPFQTVLIAVSVGTLTCMAIERYRAILTTFKTMLSQNVVKIVICAVWCLSVALVAPYPGGEGRRHFGIFWVDMCRPGLQIGTPF